MSTTRRVFPEVFKREAVDRVISSGLSVGKAAAEIGLNVHSTRKFICRYFRRQSEGDRRCWPKSKRPREMCNLSVGNRRRGELPLWVASSPHNRVPSV